MVPAKNKFYNYDKILSFNAVFNFIVGLRGNGKTYGAKKIAIAKAIKKGEQFIYLRRFKDELKGRYEFFDDIVDEFPTRDFRVVGSVAQMAPRDTRDEKKRQWSDIGFFLALSQAQSYKSRPFPKVTTIIFDEFILEKGFLRYLPDEVTTFINFYSTVDRNTDKTRVLLTANAASIMNPYFIKWKIRPDESPEFVTLKKGFMAIHFIDSKSFSDHVYASRFGKFIQDTEYAEYAVENKFKDSHAGLVSEKLARAKYQYTLETKSGVFSIWYDALLGEYFAQQKRPKIENVFTLVPEFMSDGKTLIFNSNPVMGMLRTAFRHSRMTFDDPETRNMFVEVFKQ